MRVVGNLPYNISTPLIFKLLENTPSSRTCTSCCNWRWCNASPPSPGSKNWGRLGIMAQYHCQVEHLFDVPPHAFNPPPKVQSAIVRLTPGQNRPGQLA